ncbi:MAG: CRISPR-associated helicase Cas3' [Nitrososphaeria archaeon]
MQIKQFMSHPNKLLKDHLKEVSIAAEKYVKEAGRNDLSIYAKIIGGLHDVGKYTSMFQRSLSESKKVDCSDHALISSLIAFYETYQQTSNDVYSFLSMTAIYSHHGHLKGITTVTERLLDLKYDIDIPNSCIIKQYNELSQVWDSIIRRELDWLSLSDLPYFKDLVSLALQKIFNLKGKEFGWKEYFDGLLLFSALIDADKHSAAMIEETNFELPDREKVIQYVSSLPKYGNDIEKIREELFTWAKEIYPSENEMLVLSAPTGSGKTLSGVLVGLGSHKRRLIYSLPFISIIEQTGEVLSKALGQQYVLTYHHMSFNWNESENVDLERRMMLVESWQSPIIVTTFEAFVSSFLSNKNSYLKRLHNIANSFIILDEVQSLPVEKIALILEAVKEMEKNLNTGVLLMSATIPFSTEKIEMPVRTVPNRYKIHFKEIDSFKTPSEFASVIDFSKGSTMVELNTISSAEEVYQELIKKDAELQYLSTRVIPKERIKRITDIKRKLDAGERVNLITTQIVEAGVDLDFAVAYRDLGPLDSVVQAAGRVNRNYKNKGDLYVYRIKKKAKNSSDFELVYGKITENITMSTLEELSKEQNVDLDEKDIEKALSKYFSKVKEYLRPDASRFVHENLKYIKSLEYDKINVELIDQAPKHTVFIEYDDEAKRIWIELNEELNKKEKSDAFARRERIKKLISMAQQYTVNLWEEPEAEKNEKLGWYYVQNQQVPQYYDEKLGFRVKGEENLNDFIW